MLVFHVIRKTHAECERLTMVDMTQMQMLTYLFKLLPYYLLNQANIPTATPMQRSAWKANGKSIFNFGKVCKKRRL